MFDLYRIVIPSRSIISEFAFTVLLKNKNKIYLILKNKSLKHQQEKLQKGHHLREFFKRLFKGTLDFMRLSIYVLIYQNRTITLLEMVEC